MYAFYLAWFQLQLRLCATRSFLPIHKLHLCLAEWIRFSKVVLRR
jgi:hypothetical protein